MPTPSVRRVAIVTHDSWSEYFDRRILEKAIIFAERGWHVEVFITSGNRNLTPGFFHPNLKFVVYSLIWKSRVAETIDIWKTKIVSKFARLRPVRFIPSSSQRTLSKILIGVILGILMLTERGFRTASRSFPVFTQKLIFGGLRNFVWDHDAIVFEDMPAANFFVSGGLHPKKKQILIADFHEFYSGDPDLPLLARLYWWRKEISVANCVHELIVPSERARAHLRRRALYPSLTISVVGNAAQYPSRRRDSPRKGLRDNFGPQETVLVYHGAVSRNRNFWSLLKVMREVQEDQIKLVVLAVAPTDFSQKMRELSPPNVYWHPPLPQSQLMKFIQDADGVVVPYSPRGANHSLCFPNKVGDAINIGLPILVNKGLLVLEDILSDCGNGIVVDFSSPVLGAAALRTFVTRPPDFDPEYAKSKFGAVQNQSTLHLLVQRVEENLALRTIQNLPGQATE